MIQEGPRQFDLYDFFSIFVPGAAFSLALLPFLPRDTSLPTTGVIGIVLVGGFIFGRIFHALRVIFINIVEATTHRGRFRSEITNPNELDADFVEQFYNACTDEFEEADLPDIGELQGQDEKHEEKLNSLYVLVRSAVHMDARGRSRTFQAVYDFYGSLWVVSALVGAIYITYSIVLWQDLLSVEDVGYQPYIAVLDVDFLLIFIVSAIAAYGLYKIARTMRAPYQKYFVQYLMADFILLHESGEEEEDT